jgi:hypothetical protein
VNQDEYRAARVNLTPLRPAELQVESKGKQASREARALVPRGRDPVRALRSAVRDEIVSEARRVAAHQGAPPGRTRAQLGLEVGDLIDGLKAKSRRGQPWTFESAEALSSLIGTLPKGAELVIEVLRDADKDGSFTSDELLRGTLTLE